MKTTPHEHYWMYYGVDLWYRCLHCHCLGKGTVASYSPPQQEIVTLSCEVADCKNPAIHVGKPLECDDHYFQKRGIR